jgi:hypothetical protein
MTTFLMRAMMIGVVAIGGAASLGSLAVANNQPPPIQRAPVPPQPRQTKPLVNAVMRVKVFDSSSGQFFFEIAWRFAQDRTCSGIEVTAKGSTKRQGRWRSTESGSGGTFEITESPPARQWRGRYELVNPLGGATEGEVSNANGQQPGRSKGLVRLPK